MSDPVHGSEADEPKEASASKGRSASGEPASPKGHTRREFLIGAGLFAGLLCVGGAAKAYAADGELLRPPGGQDEARLRALCLKCDRCRSACPQGCIETVTFAEGVLDARTPKLNFHEGYCDFCNKCIDACPTGALAAFDPAVDKIGVARVDASKCIAYTRGTCVVCQGSCPYDALTFDGAGHPVVDEEACNGCGECVQACNVNINLTFDGSFDRAIEVEPKGV